MVLWFTQISKVIADNSNWSSQNSMALLSALKKNKNLQRFQKHLCIALTYSPRIWIFKKCWFKKWCSEHICKQTYSCNAVIRIVSIAVTTHIHQNHSGLWAVENTIEAKRREQDSVAFVTSRGQHERDLFYSCNDASKYNLQEFKIYRL